MSGLIIFGLLIALMLTGMPISIALGLTVLTFLFTLTQVPIESVGLKLFSGLDNFGIMAIPFFILAVILEILLAKFGKAKARYEARDTATSLAMGLGSSVAGLITGGVIFAATIWIWQHRIFTIPMTAVWAWVVLFFAEDLTYYWFHRLAHERRFWWASHVNHHTSTHYNLSTALRQTWTGGVLGTWLLWLPLSFLGFPPAMVAIQKAQIGFQATLHVRNRMVQAYTDIMNMQV